MRVRAHHLPPSPWTMEHQALSPTSVSTLSNSSLVERRSNLWKRWLRCFWIRLHLPSLRPSVKVSTSTPCRLQASIRLNGSLSHPTIPRTKPFAGLLPGVPDMFMYPLFLLYMPLLPYYHSSVLMLNFSFSYFLCMHTTVWIALKTKINGFSKSPPSPTGGKVRQEPAQHMLLHSWTALYTDKHVRSYGTSWARLDDYIKPIHAHGSASLDSHVRSSSSSRTPADFSSSVRARL